MTTPVSGPGQFSKRTDRAVSAASESLPNAQYGENRDYQELRSAAPLAEGNAAPAFDITQLLGGLRRDVVPFDADSAQPNVPVTDGAALGPGAGPEAIAAPMGANQSPNRDALKASLIALEFMANRPNSSDAARNLVRKLKADLM